MKSITSLFELLQKTISRMNREDGYSSDHPWYHQLTVRESDGLIDVEYRGEFYIHHYDDDITVEVLHDLLSLLASSEIAPRLRSFVHFNEAVLAANGTYNIIIDPLFAEGRNFPVLTRLVLNQGEGEHGYRILASARNGGDGYFDEAGVLADLLSYAPALLELVTPSPPGNSFFTGGSHPLRSLNVDSGFGHENFIRNLAGCTRFPELQRLQFTEYRQTHMPNWREQTTTFEDYSVLFKSPLASKLRTITLHELVLSKAQVEKLLAIRNEGVEITFCT